MSENKKEVSLKNVIIIAGAYCAYMIGSGFSSGQELMQFFTRFGLAGIAGVVILFVVLAYINHTLFRVGKSVSFDNPYDIFEYYCGKKIALFYEWYSVVLFYGIVVTMFSGAGAVVNEYFGISARVGAIAMAVISLLTVLMGLNRTITIIGVIGPVIIVFTVIIGIVSIINNPSGLGEAEAILQTMDIKAATPHWLISGIIYPCFAMMTGVPFIASSGASTNSKKESTLAAILSAIMFSSAAMALVLSQLSNTKIIAGKQIPTLAIAQELVPILGLMYSVIILMGIYSTAAPMLWATVRKFAADGTKKSVVYTLVLVAVAIIFGEIIPFDTLVNTIYPFSGYLGLIFLAFMIVKSVKVKNISEKEKQNDL